MRTHWEMPFPWTLRLVVNLLLSITVYKTRMTGTDGRGHPMVY